VQGDYGSTIFRIISIPIGQRQILQDWRIPVRHIGYDFGRQGMADEEIIPFLHQHSGATFFTADRDFFHGELCHAGYYLVCLFVERSQTAVFIRRRRAVARNVGPGQADAFRAGVVRGGSPAGPKRRGAVRRR